MKKFNKIDRFLTQQFFAQPFFVAVPLIVFLGLFVYFLKKSGRWRLSVKAAIVGTFVFFSGPSESIAKNVDGFSQQPHQHQKNRRVLSPGSSGTKNNNPGKGNNGGSDGGDDGIPEYPKVESVEETKKHIEDMDEYIARLGQDSDSESEENQCEVTEEEDKSTFEKLLEKLPASSKYTYNLETKTAKKALKKVWKNPTARQEVLEALSKIKKGELLPRNQKDFKSFKSLKELKFSNIRMLMQPGKDGEPDKIVVICMRGDLEGLVPKLRKKYE